MNEQIHEECDDCMHEYNEVKPNPSSERFRIRWITKLDTHRICEGIGCSSSAEFLGNFDENMDMGAVEDTEMIFYLHCLNGFIYKEC